MKIYNKLILFFATVVLITSCGDEFLNPIPTSSVVATEFFSTDEEILAGIFGIYDAIQGVNENTTTNINQVNRGIQFEYLVTEMRSDNARSETTEGSKADFHRYIVDPNNIEAEDYYASMYEVIFRANNVLNFVDVANPDNIASYSAEARFLRAYAYFNLVRLYGDVPLVTSVILPTDESAFLRVPVAEVYAQIVSDLEEAASVLSDGGPKVRASKSAAEALLAKVYLSQPSPDYLAAQTLCETIIASQQFMLQDSFRDIFYNERNSELIWIVEYISGNALESQGFSAEFNFETGRQDGLNVPEPDLLSAFDQNGGLRTMHTFGTGTNNRTENIKFLPDGFGIDDDYGPNSRSAGNDWIFIRYADVLLMHAEAILAGSQLTSSSNALESVNLVRARAGLDPLTESLSAEALLLERRVELAFENQRFFDLQRFGVINNTLQAYSDDAGYIFNLNQLLLPIPAREINLSRGVMSQNPGY